MTSTLRPRPLASLAVDKLSTGCPHLDAALGGGLPCGSLTEVAGEAAASKTQLCLQLLLTAQLPHEYGGLGGSAVYVHTEGEPALKRLHQLARCLPLRYPPEALAGMPDPAANIFIEKGIASGGELLARLQRLRALLERQHRLASAAGATAGIASAAGAAGSSSSGTAARPVRLLVVDSVAHVFRDMGDAVGAAELTGRTELLFRISALLRRYADKFSLAVLLVNQVVDCVAGVGDAGGLLAATSAAPAARHAALTGGLRLVSLGREVVPALGLAWANCVNTRLFLARCGSGPDGATPALFHGSPSAAAQVAAAQAGGAAGWGGAGAALPALRKLQVLFSPHLPQAECHYIVEATGVRGLHSCELEQHDAAAAAAAAAAWQQQQAEQQRLAREQEQVWRQEQEQQSWGRPQGQQQQQGWQQQQQVQPPQQRWEQQQHGPPQQEGWQHQKHGPLQQEGWHQQQQQQQHGLQQQGWQLQGQTQQQGHGRQHDRHTQQGHQQQGWQQWGQHQPGWQGGGWPELEQQQQQQQQQAAQQGGWNRQQPPQSQLPGSRQGQGQQQPPAQQWHQPEQLSAQQQRPHEPQRQQWQQQEQQPPRQQPQGHSASAAAAAGQPQGWGCAPVQVCGAATKRRPLQQQQRGQQQQQHAW